MAEAMISGLIRNGIVDPSSIIASDPRVNRLLELENRYGIKTYNENEIERIRANG